MENIVEEERRQNIRQEILDEASKCISNDRDLGYGTPEDNFGRIAAIWSAILGYNVTPHQVALCMIGVKVARLANNPGSRDSWVDTAGYAACGAECAFRVPKEEPKQEGKRNPSISLGGSSYCPHCTVYGPESRPLVDRQYCPHCTVRGPGPSGS